MKQYMKMKVTSEPTNLIMAIQDCCRIAVNWVVWVNILFWLLFARWILPTSVLLYRIAVNNRANNKILAYQSSTKNN